MANHPHRSRRRQGPADFADVPMRAPEDERAWPPNIEEFADAPRDSDGLQRIGNLVLIPDYDITAPVDGAEHQDWRARRDAKAAYNQIVYRGSGDVREGYEAARAVLRRHLSETGRRVQWQTGAGQYLTP